MNRSLMKAGALTAAFLFLAGCGPTRIGRILADPGRYQNRNVAVEGRVTTAYGVSLPGVPVPGVYQVDDGTGKIYVLARSGGVPGKEARVKVSGTVTPGLSVGGKSYGTAIREHHHKVRF